MALSRSLSKENTSLTSTDLPALRRKRTVAFNRLRKVLEIAVSAQKDASRLGEFLVYHSALKRHVDFFEQSHFDILSIVSETDAEKEDIIRSDFDKIYYQVLTIHQMLVDTPTAGPSSRHSNLGVKLPKLDLPKFSGNIKEWSMFYDAFNSLIHLNESLSDSDRMQYLRASLFGDALGLIRTFPIQGAYYQEAYQTLINRYRDKRELAFTCWREMLNISLKMNSPTEFRRVLDLFNENLLILKSLKLPTDKWDFILCYHLLSKLDSKTRCAFENAHSSSELPDYSVLKQFLESQCEALVRDTHFSSNRELQPSASSSNKNVYKSTFSSNNKKVTSSLLTNAEKTTVQPEQTKSTPTTRQVNPVTAPGITSSKCSFCSDSHSIAHCKVFAAKPVQERHAIAKQNRWCFNCLRASHVLRDCRSVFSCSKCGQKHHTLLHQDNINSSEKHDEAGSSVRALTNTGENSVVLLSTAVIQIRDSTGNYQSLRAIIDTGSQAHFISERAVTQLGLKKKVSPRHIRGVGQSSASISGAVQIQIGINGQVAFNLNALTIPNICGNMPSIPLNKSSWLHIQGLNFADPDWDTPAPIDVLLGAEIFSSLILPGSVNGGPKQPSALNSVFGWLLIGSVGDNQADININSFFVSDDQLFQEVKKFWELDSLPSVTRLTGAEQQCEKIYRDTTTRDQSGRYSVALPFKDDVLPLFPSSREAALRRFHSLERKLTSNSGLYEQYSDFMAEYLELGHMKPVPANEVGLGKYYIPHHCVLRPDSASTKLRVVFDASNRDVITGVSLNETLLIGPKLQSNILELLLRFRTHSVVFSADVCKMYRQILINEEHRDYQRIFWRFHPSQPIMEYQLNTVTYGVSSAPFLACRTIIQLADDEGDNLPLGKAILERDVFVDDVVTGTSDLEQAMRIKAELIELLKRGGMELRKWATNVPSLLADLPPESCLSENVSMDVEKSDVLKVLGLKWDPRTDHFLFEVTPLDRVCTKRNILSELARVYDPIGFLSPLTVYAKYLVQRLWVLGIAWDEEPPEDIKEQWKRYVLELPLIKNIKIPRHLAPPLIKSCELHGFADSSMRGFGAVVYIRIRDLQDNVKVFFVMSKARVAPIKVVSLPRLELCAAVLTADVLKFVIETYKFLNVSDVYAWSDSTVTLAWIRSPPSRWKTFVANRVSHIQDAIPGARWLKVPTMDNPADIPSRGQTPAELVNNSLWWAGPNWLSEDHQCWPCSIPDTSEEELRAEEKVQMLLTNEETPHPIDDLLTRFSSIRKVQRIVALCLRFRHNNRFKLCQDSDHNLSRAELHHALLVIVKRTQFLHFQEDIQRVRDGKVLSKPMRKLNPFIDSTGVFRVGGRLSRSGLEYTQRHPALLPRQASLTYKIIDAIHRENCHPGINTTHYLVAQQFWILSAKRAIRHQVSNCVRCFKTKPTSLEPFMSDLPAVRVNQAKPFSVVGVDYAGPFRVKSGKHRGAKITKAYLVLFICLTTKCVHLDVASDMTSEAFIAALRRFVGRRGRVNLIYSDRGTNFVGAERELAVYMQNAARNEQIEFKRNPPASAHWGGVWEVQVKAVKSLLYRVIGSQSLTFEELFTLFVQIESVLNSRPLYALSSDPNDFTVLTPGHFLTLEPLTAVPDQDLTPINITRLKRWQLIQRFQQDFWKRWKNEYLQSLTQRAKWTKHSKPLDIGSVVIIKSETAPLQWPLARVEKLHASPDGVIRVATLRLPNGSFLTRPLVKICPLPSQTD